jgi:hypothetical protein
MVRAGPRLERSMIRCGCCSFGLIVFGLIRDLMVGYAISACGNPPLVFATAASICSSNPRRVEQRLPNASAHSAFLSAIARSRACCACA